MERKKEVLIRGIWAGVILLGCILVSFGVSRRVFRSYESEVRDKVAAILGTVKEQYPDIREEELIQILNADGNKAAGEQLLLEYGITKQVMLFASDAGYEKHFGTTVIISVAVCGICLIALFLGFYQKREQRLKELTEYIRHVQRGDYSLALSDNSEDELSLLQNELYKLTVMLREGLEREKHQREAVLEAVSDISHQLKTPMTSMQIMTDNLMEAENMPGEVRMRFLREISKQIEGISWLVQALLRLSRLDADVVEFASEKICAAELAEGVCDRLAVLAEVKGVSLQVIGSKEAEFYGDEGWCAEALTNLVKNAVEHSYEGGTVAVCIQENDIYIKMEVKDTGEGISPEDCRHIFDRFYKAKNASPGSVGIGLAMAKAIVEKQGGYITVDSKEGEGTTVTIKYMKLFYGKSPESHLLSVE